MESRQRYTLADVYNAAKYERNFNYTFWTHITLDILAASAMRYAGYSLVVMASSLVAIISVLGFFVVLPNLFKPWSVYMVGHSVWGKECCALSGMMSAHFLLATLRHLSRVQHLL
jgi:hypothetical protein